MFTFALKFNLEMERVTDTLRILTEEDKLGLDVPKTTSDEEHSQGLKKLYIESYGCQMNFADSEIVASILKKDGYATTSDESIAELVLLNTCSIRDNAELKIRKRLTEFKKLKVANKKVKIGVLGCMAERLKTKFLEEEKLVDLVVGPDAYRDLPNLLEEIEDGRKAVNVFLSKEETYADINPIRLDSNGVTAMISIMRGCDNMCSFCVVPYTRGRERSRDPYSIISEAKDLFNNGYREVILLGQNVDSYKWENTEKTEKISFANLLEKVALVNPELRVRFSTSHPKDITDEVLYTIKKYENICNYIHLPAQSGSSRILELMNRTYDREWYLGKINRIKEILGDQCGISQDMIAGFCTETEEDHQESISLIEKVKFDYGYMFFYSERPGTPAAKKLTDDVPLETKKRRLQEIIDVQRRISLERNQAFIGKVCKVLIEGYSKKSNEDLQGRNDENKMVIFPKGNLKIGQYVNLKITSCTSATLFGEIV
jgi:tRNA-2-methylthio-N6-dimethylallyladenosine synthase